MKPDGWNHNVQYFDLLLSAVPRPCRRALDVGCGTGSFARQLATIVDQVDAIDRDAGVVIRAREVSSGAGNLQFVQADFLTWARDGYDFIAIIAALHHMPFSHALERAAELLRPGGVLAVLGLYRNHSVLDFMISGAALPVSWYCRLTSHP